MHFTIPLVCCIFSCNIFSLNALEFSNRWTVQIDGDEHEANRLAEKHGFVNLGKVVDNYYSFQHEKVEAVCTTQSAHVHKGLQSEPNVKMVEQQELKSYHLLSSSSELFYVDDPRWDDMWYINRKSGQPTYNVIDVWKQNITGEGVVVAVVDEGLDPEHPELRGNYDKNASFDVVDNDEVPVPNNKSYPQYGHGDKCAGIIAAVANNSECGLGLAFKASLGGIRLFFKKKASDADEARALSHATHHIDIYSNSWGPGDKGFEVAGPGYLTQRALQDGTEKGRRGLGSIYVFAAGNGGIIVEDSCAFSGYVNSIYTIAITGINSDGSVPGYGEHCAGIMAVTYSRGIFGDSSLVITADTNKACTDDFGASSAATAMASGLIALMLSANRNLSWRDVQHIIVRTARRDPVQLGGGRWNTNKAGLHVNDYVGFGLMDARKMVDVAINWTSVPSKVICTIPGPNSNSRIPSKGKLEVPMDLSEWGDSCGDAINYLEHVEVGVNLTYTLRGELLIKLISPQGTVSNLTHYRMSDSSFGAKDLNWVLMTLHHWGENAIGVWKLTLENYDLNHENTGTLFNWTLILHGTTLNPLEYNRHVPSTVSPQTTENTLKSTPAHSPTAVCPDPGAPAHGRRLNNDFQDGKMVAFECNQNYDLLGSKTITCNGGLWSDSAPQCKDCGRPLGMEAHKIEDFRITSPDWNSFPRYARLNGHFAWCTTKGVYLQIDLGKRHKLTAISTQGRKHLNSWVKRYQLAFIVNSDIRVFYSESGSQKIIEGNRDASSIVKYSFKEPFVTTVVRIYPVVDTFHVCLRVELYGCDPKPDCILVGSLFWGLWTQKDNSSNYYQASITKLNATHIDFALVFENLRRSYRRTDPVLIINQIPEMKDMSVNARLIAVHVPRMKEWYRTGNVTSTGNPSFVSVRFDNGQERQRVPLREVRLVKRPRFCTGDI